MRYKCRKYWHKLPECEAITEQNKADGDAVGKEACRLIYPDGRPLAFFAVFLFAPLGEKGLLKESGGKNSETITLRKKQRYKSFPFERMTSESQKKLSFGRRFWVG